MITLAVIFNLPILIVILKKGYLTIPYGVTTAAFLGVILFIVQPFFWIVLCIFFFSSSVLSKVKAKEKSVATLDFEKGTPKRDSIQVIANGIIPLLFTLSYALFEVLPNLVDSNITFYNPMSPFFVGVFLSFAVHTADTWATEIGILSKTPPRLVTKLSKEVNPGTSGGITIVGCIASLFGGILISVVYLIAVLISTAIVIERMIIISFIIILGGFLGSIIDSIEGATIQGIYYCNHCEKETESNPHKRCGNNTVLCRGNQQINNDFVNLSSALVISFLGSLFVSLL